MSATNVTKPLSLAEKILDLRAYIESIVDPHLERRQTTVCLQRLEALAEELRGAADMADRLAAEVAEVCVDQREEHTQLWRPIDVEWKTVHPELVIRL